MKKLNSEKRDLIYNIIKKHKKILYSHLLKEITPQMHAYTLDKFLEQLILEKKIIVNTVEINDIVILKEIIYKTEKS